MDYKLNPILVKGLLKVAEKKLITLNLEEAEDMISKTEKELQKEFKNYDEEKGETEYMANLADLRDLIEQYIERELYN